MLSGRVALVTGAAQGIGLSTVKLLLRNGAKVCVSDISPTLQQTCEELEREFNKDSILCLSCDVTNSTQLRQTFEQTKAKFGSLDIVINNAGIVDEHQWEKTIQVNLMALMEGNYLSIEMMSNGGAVVNVASTAGYRVEPMSPTPAYTASKFGVVGFTRAIKNRAETCSIRVNCICPSLTDTPLARKALEGAPKELKAMLFNLMAKPELIAEGILQLITDETRSGAVMVVTPKRGIHYHTFPDDSQPFNDI